MGGSREACRRYVSRSVGKHGFAHHADENAIYIPTHQPEDGTLRHPKDRPNELELNGTEDDWLVQMARGVEAEDIAAREGLPVGTVQAHVIQAALRAIARMEAENEQSK